MPRILIFDGAPAAAQAALAGHGGLTNKEMFETALRRHAPEAGFVTVNVADGESLPAGTSLSDFDAVAITGSPLNVYDREPAVLRQIDFAREVLSAGLPVWGSCWGLQLATVALGGAVRRNPKGRELGVARAIRLTEAGRAHPLFRGKPDTFDALCSHVDEVETLPEGATVLATNGVSAVQGLACGSFLGVQYHPEHTFTVSAAIISQRAARLVEEGLGRSEDGLAALAADYREVDANPARRDLAWRYGLDREVLDPLQRSAELGNWLHDSVLPRAATRAAAAARLLDPPPALAYRERRR